MICQVSNPSGFKRRFKNLLTILIVRTLRLFLLIQLYSWKYLVEEIPNWLYTQVSRGTPGLLMSLLQKQRVTIDQPLSTVTQIGDTRLLSFLKCVTMNIYSQVCQ